jgi:hypothetical protein
MHPEDLPICASLALFLIDDQPESLPPHYCTWNYLPLWTRRNQYMETISFNAKKYSKMQPSNRICDCIHFIIAETGQHAGLISSKQDVLTEPVNLAQHNPTSSQTCRYIDQSDTYICRSSLYTILAIGY